MTFNLMRERQRGTSVSSLRSGIRRNMEGNWRQGRDGRLLTLNLVLERRQLRDKLAVSLRHAIISGDDSEALDALNNLSSIRGSYTTWSEWLEDKFGATYFQCYDCDTLDIWDNSHNVRDDYRVCDCCVENYYYSERNQYYDDDEDDEDDDSGYCNIGGRHSSKHKLGHIASSFDSRKPRVLLGLELEMEISRDMDMDDKAADLLNAIGHIDGSKYCLIEEDGSIGHGFEMVTGYTGLDIHKRQLSFFKNRFVGAKSHNTTTCGLHVHVCKSDMTMLHAAKMILFINDEKNRSLVKAIARRDSSSWAKVHDKQNDKYWLRDAMGYDNKAAKLRHLNSDRYEALNFQNEKTVEFRIFKGTLKYSTIMACLEFTYATWFFSRDTSQTRLTTDEFLQFICLENNRRDTTFLRAYLVEKGFVLPFTKKPRPEVFGGSINSTSEEI